MPPRAGDPVVRFWSKVEKTEGCWLWKATTFTATGYGLFHAPSGGTRPKMVGAHRYAWEITNGPIPAGMCVCHRCDVRTCVRPDHLFIGTHAENMADMRAKGRGATGDRSGARKYPERYRRGDNHPVRLRPELVMRGARNGMAKLTEEQVIAIRTLHAAGVSQAEIARRFGITPQNVHHIRHGITWRHVNAAS